MIKLLFVRTPTLGSLLIRVLTLSAWSHVAVALPDGSVIEATAAHGVIRRSRAAFDAALPSQAMVPVLVPDEAAAARWLNDQVGRPYDRSALWGFLMPWRRWQDPAAWFCSELAAAGLRAGGYPVPVDAWRITPRGLRDLTRGTA